MIDGHVLKVDIDQPYSDFNIQEFLIKLDKLEVITGITTKGQIAKPSKNGNTHIRVHMTKELLPLEKLFLQCWLGDDRLRCLFNFRRIRRGQLNWNILFCGDDEK